MEEIQSTCAMPGKSREDFVVQNVNLIADADFRRDVEHDDAVWAPDASISMPTAKLKVTWSDNRWLRVKMSKLKSMQIEHPVYAHATRRQRKLLMS
ncbi:hypothetical protein [Roseobacter cerasinus]|uniref:hypothetical protein n=1 Tax=Roseobacter cerasinus TaxID=2602289 RepID=UPI0013575031|nr:hypothetical protein [Roseobacter cerasinus]